jgi:sugar O-acyltransferase (sialic acid O-acetyltransferase NeuD family)
MKRYILGAGEQGKIVIPNLMERMNLSIDGFFDDNSHLPLVVGGFDDLEKVLTSEDELYFGMGSNEIREQVFGRMAGKVRFPNLIDPSAIIANNVQLGSGIVIAQGVIINSQARVGNGCLINTGVVLEHDTIIGDYANMEPTSATMGGVHIGRGATVGPRAIVCEDFAVGDYAHIGAGSTVLTDVPGGYLAYGTPAKLIKRIKEE